MLVRRFSETQSEILIDGVYHQLLRRGRINIHFPLSRSSQFSIQVLSQHMGRGRIPEGEPGSRELDRLGTSLLGRYAPDRDTDVWHDFTTQYNVQVSQLHVHIQIRSLTRALITISSSIIVSLACSFVAH